MSSAADRARDPGLAWERTALAWQRSAMGFTSLAALTLAAAAHRDSSWMLLPAGVLFACAAVVWRYARRRHADRGLKTDARALAWLAAGTAVGALMAFVMSLVPGS
jgi:uncharacterized membrane protein YidH (DUF202 family)